MNFETEYDEISRDTYVENEMQRCKDAFCRRLSCIVHPEYVNDFARILTHCWFDSVLSAEIIANKLDLTKLDFLAMADYFQPFKQEFLNEQAQNF